MATQGISKAQLIELDDKLAEMPQGKGKVITVQFNPDSLKLAFANQIQNSNPASGGGSAGAAASGGDQGSGTSGRQFVGAGTTKLTVQLWFDANAAADGERVDDVRRLTQKVIYFISPKPLESDKTKFVPPGLRFSWGSFTFDGLVDSIEETIEFFSPDGKPLRASIAMGMSQQTILMASFDDRARPPGAPGLPGTAPLTAAAAGSTLQGLAAAAGGDWQGIAAANGIENPRALVPGQLIDLAARVSRGLF
jgi:hypothetical protein